MFAVPGPGAFDDFANRVPRLPTQLAFGSRSVGDELRRIAFTAADGVDIYRATGDFAAEVDDFLHAGAVTGAEI